MASRTDCIKLCVEAGYNAENLKRMPTYEMEKLLHKAPAQTKPKEEEEKIYRQKEETFSQQQGGKDDDTETVVDMSHFTGSTSPAEQKYNRFKSLVKFRNTIHQAIKENTALKNSNRSNLDEDDIFVI